MTKPKPIQINIPNPCSKSWDEMTPSGNGRHCVHCDKVVTDFTKYTDQQLYTYFSQSINQHSCGRFTALQVNRPVLPPPQPHSRLYRLFIGLGLTLLLTQIPIQEANSKTPYVSCYDRFMINENEQEMAGDDSVRITGVVVDEKNAPVLAAIIEIKDEKGLLKDCATDMEGHFSLAISKEQLKKDLKLVAIYATYKTQILKLDEAIITSSIRIQMELRKTRGEVIIMTGAPVLESLPSLPYPEIPGSSTIITSEQIEKMPH